jgi:hypothetical protein
MIKFLTRLANQTSIALLICCSLTNPASAKSIYEAQNGDTINATISSTDLTRIEVSGQKIIKNFSSANVSKRITKPLGQIYLVPNINTTFNLYVVSDTGNTYNLHLTPSKNETGDSIIIKPIADSMEFKKSRSLVGMQQANTSPYVRNINYLLQVMYLNKDDSSQYDVADINQAIITYDNLDSVLLRKYSNDNLAGYILLLKNTSKSKMLLTEAEFYSPHTLAVAIENPNLLVNDFTRVFLIKEVE